MCFEFTTKYLQCLSLLLVMSSTTFNDQARHQSDAQLLPRYPPWAYGKGAKGKGGAGGAMVDRHGGRYTPYGYEHGGEHWE